MQLDQLEAFLHVAELSSFTRASAILGRTQPALSRLVRQLEVDLRQTLLRRNGRGVALTEAGKVLLEYSQGILHQVESAKHALNNLQGTLDGQFKIGLAPSVSKFATLALVRVFQKHFPQARITVAEGLSSHLVEWLMMGRIDAAILYDTADTPLIEKRHLFTEELFLISQRPAHPPATRVAPAALPLRELGRYPLIIPGRLHAIRTLVERHAAERGIKLNIGLEVDAVTSVLDLVEEGYGHAVLPLNAVLADQRRRHLQVTPIVEPAIYSRLAIATSKQHPMSKLAAQAVALIGSEILPLYQARQALIAAGPHGTLARPL